MDMKKIPYLHRPIQIEIGGTAFNFLTVGHCAKAVGRTTATIKNWERLGVFPRPHVWLYPNRMSARRRLYPQAFVESLSRIAASGHVGVRMERHVWHEFHDEVWEAYNRAVEPIIQPGARGVTKQADEMLGV